MFTERLELRLPVEADRGRFVELFCDEAFMEFSGAVLDEPAANERFDRMLECAGGLRFAKQPVIERSSGQLMGYSGVAWFEFEGEPRLEFGYRLAKEARGKGYATEAGRALLAVATRSYEGEILAMIDPTNEPSQRVAAKLGFDFWKQATVNGYLDNLYRITISSADRQPD